MQRLSGIDSTFLSIETPSHHMHVAMVAVFDPTDMPGGYSFERVKAMIASRLPRIPLFRRRLAEVPFNLHFPVWVEDPDFDLDYHVRRVAAPAPGSTAELCAMGGDFVSRQLDRTKPLWEMQIVEGLAGGKIGVLAKVHHSTIDGVSGAEMMVHLFDLEPVAAPDEPVPDGRPIEHVPSDFELVAYAARSIATNPVRLVRLIPATVGSVVGLVRTRRRSEGPGMAAPFNAPRTPFNAAITAHRRVAISHLALADVKRVKKAFGTTVNDVVLALCAGALRGYLDKLGELPDAPLVAVVPISVRDEVADESSSNQVSAMFVSLATDIADPVERLRAIAEGTRGAKEDHKAIGASMLQDWAQFAAPAVFARASRLYSSMKLADRHRPIHNVIISNVPGPPFPLYLAGAKLLMLCPLGPVMEGAGLNITVLSYQDSIDVGLIACSELMPDLDDLAADFVEAMGELLAVTEAAEERASASIGD
jgi:WS/DGAT/MGAT family acyltransferase